MSRTHERGRLGLTLGLSICLALLLGGPAPARDGPEIRLRVGAYENHPKVYTAADGRVTGFFPAILEYIAREEGWIVDYRQGTWQECMDRLARGEIDLMMDVAVSAEREALYDFNGETVLISWAVIYTRPDVNVQSFFDLSDRRIALMKGSIYTEGRASIRELLNQFSIPARYSEYPSYREVFQALADRRADAGVVNNIFGSCFEREFDVVRSPVLFSPAQLRFAFPKGAPLGRKLAPALDARLRALKKDRASFYYRAMDVHLYGLPQTEADLGTNDWRVVLSAAEKKWIEEHSEVRLGIDPEFYPFEYRGEKGEYQGIASDYVRLFSERLGLNLRVVEGLAWTSAVDQVRQGRIDVLPCVGHTQERAKHLLFSKPYTRFERVILTRADAPFITGLRDIESLRVGVQADTSHEGFVRESSSIRPILYGSLQDCLLALAGGKVDAVVANVASAAYWIRKLNLISLKVAAPTSAEPGTLHFAVRRDWPELVSILNKAIDLVSPDEQRAIEHRWVAVEYTRGIEPRVAWRIGLRLAAGVLLVLAAILVWNYRLKREIAHRREIEQRLQELDRLKSLFIASVSHELRTPLNSIIGFTGVILKGMAGELNDRQRDQLTRVKYSAEHLLALITDIIDISKIEAGRIDTFPKTFLLEDAISEALESVRPQLEAKNLALDTDLAHGLEVHTDRKRLQQCLLNYLSNAVKYSETGRVRVVSRDLGDEFEVAVSDTGIGISEEDQAKIFEPFVRLDSHLRIKAGGTGLGLYLTRKIATELLKGSIRITSEKGRGSTFGLRAPKRLPAGAGANGTEGRDEARAGD